MCFKLRLQEGSVVIPLTLFLNNQNREQIAPKTPSDASGLLMEMSFLVSAPRGLGAALPLYKISIISQDDVSQ